MCRTSLKRQNSSIPLSPKYITDENIDENLDKLNYLINYFSSGMKKRFFTYTKFEQYMSLYNKYYAEKGKNKHSCEASTTTIVNKSSVVEYLLTHDIDYISMNTEEIIAFTKRLNFFLDEATAALELIKEDITSKYESMAKQLKDSYELELANLDSLIKGDSPYKIAV